jgi:1,4-dihydroxy-2-naphthoyl-CoA synthase
MDRGLGMGMLEGQQLAIEALGELFQSDAVREGVAAFMEKRAPRF